MEGLNYLFLGVFLCIVAIIIGGVVFIPLLLVTRVIITKKFGGKYKGIGIPIALTIATAVACALFYITFAPAFPGYYTPQRHPDLKDIIGTWTPTTNTLELMKKSGYLVSTHSLEFRGNGDFIMTNMPDMIFWRHKGVFYSGFGKWSIARDFQGYWVINVIFSSLKPPYYPDPPLSGPTPCPGKPVPCDGLNETLYMSSRQPPYTLYFEISGDELGPDFYFYRLGDIHNP